MLSLWNAGCEVYFAFQVGPRLACGGPGSMRMLVTIDTGTDGTPTALLLRNLTECATICNIRSKQHGFWIMVT